ncbi:MAG: EXPERA domain-containing protein [Solimonas sp.]
MNEARRFPLWDGFFIVAFSVFVLVAFVHEPLFYLYCGWDGLRQDTCSNETVAAIWKGYAIHDPVYFDMPLWMALMIGFDSVLLSPFYVYAVYAFARRRADTPLFRAIGYSVSGAAIYAMLLYLSWETMTAKQYQANLVAVWGYNLPWGVVPLLLIFRLYRGQQTV